MNRTRYRLPAIAIASATATIMLRKLVPGWTWMALAVGASASIAEIARHYGDLQNIIRNWLPD